MKPSGIFLILLSVLLVLGIISLIFPSGGLRLGSDLILYFPNPEDLLPGEDLEYADISDLTDTWQKSGDSLSFIEPAIDLLADSSANNETGIPIADGGADVGSMAGPGISESYDTPVTDEEELRKFIFPIEFPHGNDTVLVPFFSSLSDQELDGSPLRILHYGDSQIENNRISSTLRNRFQARFGGSGIGMFPVVSPVVHSASVEVKTQGSWGRYTPLETTRSNNHGRYGLLMSYSAISEDKAGNAEGSFTIKPTRFGHIRSRTMKELSIFLGYNSAPFLMEITHGGETINAELFFPADSITFVSQTLPSATGEYSVLISGEGSPEIHAVSVNDVSGIAVDNIPMRGSSGLEFSRADTTLVKRMIEVLNVRLVLLQFGVNVVPGLADDYTFYENAFRRQLEFFRHIDDRLCIIVVGVSDMARKTRGGKYESYPNIELIRNAQRNAAFQSGYAFWDLYNAMGGRNSMPSWVMNSPPLGQPDYTHFTYRGSALVGDMLYNSIAEEYNKWRSN